MNSRVVSLYLNDSTTQLLKENVLFLTDSVSEKNEKASVMIMSQLTSNEKQHPLFYK